MITTSRRQLLATPGLLALGGAIPAGCAFNPRCVSAGPRCLRERPELMAVGEGANACWLNAGGNA